MKERESDDVHANSIPRLEEKCVGIAFGRREIRAKT